MNELTKFNNPEFGTIRTVSIGTEPWFLGKDVAEALGYTNPRKAMLDHVDEEDKVVTKCDTLGGAQLMTVINESGLYSLILGSKLESSKKFKKWVTGEVLPTIRNKGMYMTDAKAYEVVNNPNSLADLLAQAAEQLRQKDIRIAEMKPKEVFADAVTTSNSLILIGELAKLIQQNGISIGQNRLFNWMRKNGYLLSSNMPSQRAMDMGLFKVLERTVNNPDGSVRVTYTTKVTGKGQQYFINKFLGGE